MDQWLSALLVSIIAGIILLIFEYRTRWFRPRSEVNRPNGETSEPQDADFATAIYNVRMNLGKMYGIKPDEVIVIDWEVQHRGHEIHLTVEFPQQWSFGATAIDTYAVVANSAGQILKCERPSRAVLD